MLVLIMYSLPIHLHNNERITVAIESIAKTVFFASMVNIAKSLLDMYHSLSSRHGVPTSTTSITSTTSTVPATSTASRNRPTIKPYKPHKSDI